MQAAKRLSMVILMQKDLDAAVSFYQELGCNLVFRLKDKWAELALNGIQIGLCPSTEDQEDHRTGLVFEIEDLMAFYKERKDEFCFLRDPLEKIHGIMVSLKDPSGNIIDLYQPTPERIKEVASQAVAENDSCCSSKKGCC